MDRYDSGWRFFVQWVSVVVVGGGLLLAVEVGRIGGVPAEAIGRLAVVVLLAYALVRGVRG